MKKALMIAKGASTKSVLTLSRNATESLTGNPAFPVLMPTLAELQTGYDTLDAADAKAAYGSRQDKAACRAAKAAQVDLLRQLCMFLNTQCNGNEEMLAGTGFRLSKTPQPSVLGTAQPSLAYGETSGVMTSATPKVPGAVSYRHQYTPDAANGPWLEVVTSRSKAKLVNLTPGVVYSSRIVALGTGEQVTVSEVVSKMAV